MNINELRSNPRKIKFRLNHLGDQRNLYEEVTVYKETDKFVWLMGFSGLYYKARKDDPTMPIFATKSDAEVYYFKNCRVSIREFMKLCLSSTINNRLKWHHRIQKNERYLHVQKIDMMDEVGITHFETLIDSKKNGLCAIFEGLHPARIAHYKDDHRHGIVEYYDRKTGEKLYMTTFNMDIEEGYSENFSSLRMTHCKNEFYFNL